MKNRGAEHQRYYRDWEADGGEKPDLALGRWKGNKPHISSWEVEGPSMVRKYLSSSKLQICLSWQRGLESRGQSKQDRVETDKCRRGKAYRWEEHSGNVSVVELEGFGGEFLGSTSLRCLLGRKML